MQNNLLLVISNRMISTFYTDMLAAMPLVGDWSAGADATKVLAEIIFFLRLKTFAGFYFSRNVM